MHVKILITLFAVLFVNLACGQVQRDCEELERKCLACGNRLVNNFNKQCRQKTQNRYVWRDLTRCELSKINCLGWERRMSCDDVADLAGMPRTRT